MTNMSKQRLFEMMGQLDPNFKQVAAMQVGTVVEKPVNELGAKMAGIAINRNLGGDLRTNQISKDAIASLFRKYLGRDIPFFMKVRGDDQATKFELVEVGFDRDMSMRQEYSSLNNGSNYVLKLHFYNANGNDESSPYGENRKDLILKYLISHDEYMSPESSFYYNQYAINLLLFAALTIRKAYFNAFPIYLQVPDENGNKINSVKTEDKMKTKLNKQSFRQFSYDSKNIENRTNVVPKPEETW